MKQWKTISGTQIFRILGLRCNVFLVQKGEHSLMFDSSMKSEVGFLARRLRGVGLKSVDAMICSHTHFDHTGNAAYLRERFRAPVFVHHSEAHFLEQGRSPLPKGTMWLTAKLIQYQKKHGVPSFSYDPCPVDHRVTGPLKLEQTGLDAVLIETPGHSSGSMSLIIDQEIALVGDAMCHQFPGKIFPPFGDSPEMVVESWGKLLSSSCTLFLPAHGKPVSRALLEKWYKRKSV